MRLTSWRLYLLVFSCFNVAFFIQVFGSVYKQVHSLLADDAKKVARGRLVEQILEVEVNTIGYSTSLFARRTSFGNQPFRHHRREHWTVSRNRCYLVDLFVLVSFTNSLAYKLSSVHLEVHWHFCIEVELWLGWQYLSRLDPHQELRIGRYVFDDAVELNQLYVGDVGLCRVAC